MTDIEVLQKCINDLGQISIPASMIEQIGIPVYNVRQNLISLHLAVLDKIEEDKAETEN